MSDPSREIGKWFLIAAVIFLVIGLILYFGSRLLPFGRLPGDIHLEGKNFSFYFPLGTSILISIILTIILNMIFSIRR